MKNTNNNRSFGFTMVEALVVVIIAFTVLVSVAGIMRGIAGTSEGKRIGTLTKFSYKGIFIKSYEGELNMGGLRNRTDSEGNRSMVANVWQFSVTNPQIAQQLDNLLGKEVVLKYHQSFTGFSRDTSYDVVGVEEVKH